jgi:SAM-dependent methyltransferase
MVKDEMKVHEGYYYRLDKSNVLRYEWYAKKYFKGVKNKKILEIGVGNGGVIQFLKQDNEVRALDISKNAVKFMKEFGIKCYLADISNQKIPFKDSYFDYVIILETLEHLKSPQFAVEEIQRVLKKDGIAVISVPNPRNGHKLMYPCLFRYRNFYNFLTNNRFEVLSTTSYGICPPFWRLFKNMITNDYKRLKNKNKSGEYVTIYTRIARILSSDFISSLKPKIFGWSFVYLCKNVNPQGATVLYKDIAEDTKQSY